MRYKVDGQSNHKLEQIHMSVTLQELSEMLSSETIVISGMALF